MTPGIRPLIAGNWKMNGMSADIGELKAMAEGAFGGADALICVPATLMTRAREALDGKLHLGGQDCHTAASGAHTGDISAEMLADAGATHVLVGHSERRTDHGETDGIVADKAEAAWRAGLTAVICIGETKAEREAGDTLSVLSRQISGSVPKTAQAKNTVVAYEPVWAIGTGESATPEQAQEVHAMVRSTITDHGDPEDFTRILYGGSVNDDNAKALFEMADIDGALVGSASLNVQSFMSIAESAG